MFKRLVLWALIALSLTEFCWRSISTVSRGGINDFQDPYIGAKLWLTGTNPYDPEGVKETWSSSTGQPPFRELKTVYPVTAYLLLSPFGLLPYRIALALWLSVLVGSVYLVGWIVWTQRWLGESLLSTLALVGSYSPFHTALHSSNCAPLPLALALASCTVMNQAISGILLALAICIKPQVAVWFVLFFVVRKRMRAFWWCLATGAITAALAFAPFAGELPKLVNDYQSQYRKGFENGASGDYTRDKSDRLSMVNLQPAVYQIAKSRSVANGIALSVFVLLMAFWIYLTSKNRNDLLVISSLAVLAAVPLYRRTTDIGLFVLPLIWAFTQYQRRLAIFAGLCAGIFFIPIHSLLARYEVYGLLSGVQSWLVVALAAALIAAMWGSQQLEMAKPGGSPNPG